MLHAGCVSVYSVYSMPQFQASPKAAELASFAPPITEKQQLPLLPSGNAQRGCGVKMCRNGKTWDSHGSSWINYGQFMTILLWDEEIRIVRLERKSENIAFFSTACQGSPPLAASLVLNVLVYQMDCCACLTPEELQTLSDLRMFFHSSPEPPELHDLPQLWLQIIDMPGCQDRFLHNRFIRFIS